MAATRALPYRVADLADDLDPEWVDQVLALAAAGDATAEQIAALMPSSATHTSPYENGSGGIAQRIA